MAVWLTILYAHIIHPSLLQPMTEKVKTKSRPKNRTEDDRLCGVTAWSSALNSAAGARGRAQGKAHAHWTHRQLMFALIVWTLLKLSISLALDFWNKLVRINFFKIYFSTWIVYVGGELPQKHGKGEKFQQIRPCHLDFSSLEERYCY